MQPIPADECRTLEKIIKSDLEHATILSASVCVDATGRIEVEEITLRLYGGRVVVLAPEMRNKYPMIALEINTGHGWRDVTVAGDYSEELEDLTGAPWRPGDDADRPEDRI